MNLIMESLGKPNVNNSKQGKLISCHGNKKELLGLAIYLLAALHSKEYDVASSDKIPSNHIISHSCLPCHSEQPASFAQVWYGDSSMGQIVCQPQ